MKNIKNKILDFNFKKYILVIVVLFLFVSAVGLALIDFSSIKIGQACLCGNCQEQ